MIYHVYWAGCGIARTMFNGPLIDRRAALTTHIKLGEDNSYVFVIGKEGGYYDDFLKWVKKEGLEDNIMYTSPTGITNPIHSDRPYNLMVIVMANKKHFWRELTPEDESVSIEEGVCV